MKAIDGLAQLKALHPDHFSDRHLRTTQRMVKAWCVDQARRMMRCWTTALTIVV